jgi:hypothetical protein
VGLDIDSLKGCPRLIDRQFRLNGLNKLTHLDDFPEKVKDVTISNCPNLETLGNKLPNSISGSFELFKNLKISDLSGIPLSIGENLYLTSMEGVTSFNKKSIKVGKSVVLGLGITDFSGIDEFIAEIGGPGLLTIYSRRPVSNILGIFNIKGIKTLTLSVDGGHNPHPAEKIINKYLHLGQNGMFKCQDELIDHGFEQLANM